MIVTEFSDRIKWFSRGTLGDWIYLKMDFRCIKDIPIRCGFYLVYNY